MSTSPVISLMAKSVFCLCWHFPLVLSLVPCPYCGRCSVSSYVIRFVSPFFFNDQLQCAGVRILGDLVSISFLKNIISGLGFQLLLEALLQKAKILCFPKKTLNFSKAGLVYSSLKKEEVTNE